MEQIEIIRSVNSDLASDVDLEKREDPGETAQNTEEKPKLEDPGKTTQSDHGAEPKLEGPGETAQNNEEKPNREDTGEMTQRNYGEEPKLGDPSKTTQGDHEAEPKLENSGATAQADHEEEPKLEGSSKTAQGDHEDEPTLEGEVGPLTGEEPAKKLTDEEMEEIGRRFNGLTQDELTQAIDIIEKYEEIPGDDEIEIDFEAYKQVTLRELLDFLREHVPDTPKHGTSKEAKGKTSSKSRSRKRGRSSFKSDPDAEMESEYKTDTKLLCLDKVDNFYREVKIVGVGKKGDKIFYVVHYMGWNAKYDETILEDDAPKRFKDWTPKSAKMAKSAIEKRLSTEKKKVVSRRGSIRPTNEALPAKKKRTSHP